MYRRPYNRNPYPAYRQDPPYSYYYPMMNGPADYQHDPFVHQTPYELFAKPAQPAHLLSPASYNPMNQPSGNPGKNGMLADPQGQLDFDKMISSIGQIASTYHQVSPIVKQLSSLMKMIR